MNFFKSPLNYTGGKHKLLPQILPLFPEQIDTFVDLFGGGGNVFVNVPAQHHIYNELMPQVAEFMSWIRMNSPEESISQVKHYVDTYGLSKTNQDGYLRLRADYNAAEQKLPSQFYALVSHSFNNQIRFNSRGEYNMPFGKNRSSFNPTLEARFYDFARRVRELDLTVVNDDFYEIPMSWNSFVYCDPPYLVSTASYNEQDGWTLRDEERLLYFLNYLHSNGIKFALSNVLSHQGETNVMLEEWAKDYTVHQLIADYSNASYHKKDRDTKSVEVLITNY